MSPDAPYYLTPAAVQTLRDSLHWRVANGREDNWDTPGVALIIWSASDSLYILRCGGRPMAQSADIAPLAACLRAERAEPGFIARIMDPATDCRTASLAPDAALAEKHRLSALQAEIRAHTQSSAETKRHVSVKRRVDVSKITLDDLI